MLSTYFKTNMRKKIDLFSFSLKYICEDLLITYFLCIINMLSHEIAHSLKKHLNNYMKLDSVKKFCLTTVCEMGGGTEQICLLRTLFVSGLPMYGIWNKELDKVVQSSSIKTCKDSIFSRLIFIPIRLSWMAQI